MAITSEFLGTLGGPPATSTQTVTGGGTASVPAGWGSAWAIFQGTVINISTKSVTVFGRVTQVDINSEYLASGTHIGGSVLLTGTATSDVGSGLSGTITYIKMT